MVNSDKKLTAVKDGHLPAPSHFVSRESASGFLCLLTFFNFTGGAKKKEESDSEVEFGSGSEEESSSEEEDENAKKKVSTGTPERL